MAGPDLVHSIADSSAPNPGRIYDYLLGGNHNFEVDRRAADELVKLVPLTPKVFKLIRWFLGEAARILAADGYGCFLDFASALPTVGHVHHVTPEGTKVIYSDIDPVTVSYAQEITAAMQNVRYLKCDAANPEAVLRSGVVEELFGPNRRVAIGYNGILWFLSDEKLSHAVTALYDWAAPGSKLYVTTGGSKLLQSEKDPKLVEMEAQYEKMGQRLYPRDPDAAAAVLAPWKLVAPGFRFVEEWLDVSPSVNHELIEQYRGVGLYGAILEKPL